MATFALFAWPFVGAVLFLTLGTARGLIWTFLLGYLFLPEAHTLNVPGLPPYHKTAAISLACLLGWLVTVPQRRRATPTGDVEKIDTTSKWLYGVLVSLVFLLPVLTILTNGEPLFFGPRAMPGLTIRDYVSMTWGTAVLVIPFLLAKAHLADRESHAMLLKALVLCGLGYSLLVLVELRLSPQLHRWVYGYFQHSWVQHIRGGGFRPIVFLEHGLAVGFFLFSATVAATALMRMETVRQRRLMWFLVAAWLSIILASSRNLGALAIGVLMLPIVALSPRRVQIWVMLAISLVFLAYPALRQAQVIPLLRILEIAESIDPGRASSLAYRIEVEDAVLARASEKPLFGWGGWVRYRVFDEFGRDTTTVDGYWVQTLGERGWLGFLGFFGFIALPILLLAKRRSDPDLTGSTIGLAFVLCGYLIYIIPNSAFGLFVWPIAGAIAGFAQREPASGPARPSPTKIQNVRAVGYSRFPPQASRARTVDTH